MRPRTELALALGALVTLAVAVTLLASRPPVDRDRRASTFRTNPLGTRALFDAATAVGTPVSRFRDRPQRLPPPDSSVPTLLVILAPPAPLTPAEVTSILQYARGADLLIAGATTDGLMRCFGYKVVARALDSTRVDVPGGGSLQMAGHLVATGITSHTDSSRLVDGVVESCAVPPVAAVERLLTSTAGVVALRLTRQDVPHSVTLISDANLFRNSTIRDSPVGPFALRLLSVPSRHLLFDEYHQGYGRSGSLGTTTWRWSLTTPWGWAVWQLIGVGLLMLLTASLRFGPIWRFRRPARRSPLEHVQALATALSTADGNDLAIAAQVRGLRRRLSRSTSHPQEDWRAWLNQLAAHATTPESRLAITDLIALTTPGQPRSSVRLAADAVERVWISLQH